jgi:heme oxygenase
MNNKDVDNNRCTFLDNREDRSMKVSKGQGLLYIFDILIDKHQLKKNDIIDELQITELTFWRYIQEIKAFMYNFNLPYELVYDRSLDTYKLIEN